MLGADDRHRVFVARLSALEEAVEHGAFDEILTRDQLASLASDYERTLTRLSLPLAVRISLLEAAVARRRRHGRKAAAHA